MSATRRWFVGGASLVAAALSRSAAAAPNPAPASADPADFEAALRAKFAKGDVLNWTGGNVRLKRPIVIDVTSSLVGAGLDLNGAKLITEFKRPSQSDLPARIPATAQK